MISDNMISIPNYVLYRHDRQNIRKDSENFIKKGGGVAVYIKQDIHVDSIILQHINKSNENLEIQCLVLRPSNQKRYILLNVYRPPSGNFQLFIDTIIECLDKIMLYDNLETFVMGDFNIDLNDNQNPNSKILIESFQHYGLSQHIINPTRFSKNNPPSLIDHIYSNSKCIKEYGNITLNINDHDMVYIIRKKDKSPDSSTSFKGRSYRDYDTASFQDSLQNRNWNDFYEKDDVNQAWAIMKESIILEIDEMCPLKTIKIKKQKDPWVSNDLLELIHDKYDLLALAKTTNSPDDWQAARIARNYVASLVKEAKKDFLTTVVENDHDPKKFRKKLHSLFLDKPLTGKINLKNCNTGEMLTENQIPDYINSFFVNVGTNIIDAIDFNLDEWTFDGIEYPSLFTLNEVTIENVVKEIKGLKLSKPSGVDNISTKLIKDALWILAHQFTHLLNLSIHTSKIPDEWKKAKITPIPKDGDLTDVKNFRPMAILPIMSKVMEHLIHSQTMSYLEEINILDTNQGVFRKNNSTTATTSSMLDDIYTNINNQQITYSVFIDLRKAFDSINHNLIICKLNKIGFQHSATQWFEDYLTNRTQFTMANGTGSSLLGVECGVPQGSVLGPLLFLIFINDMGNSIKNNNYKLYADNTVLYSRRSGDSDVTQRVNIQSDLNNVQNWCKKNAIMMNVWG